MKILILVRGFPPMRMGGTELATLSMANHLSKKNHEVHVVTYHEKGNYDNQKYNFFVHRIQFPKLKFIGVITFSFKVLKLVFQIKPDITHAQGMGMGFTAFMIKTFANVKYVIWGRGTDVFTNSIFKKLIYKLGLGGACTVISLTRGMERKIIEIHKIKNSIVLPNGIDLFNYQENYDESMGDLINFFNNTKIIIFVGNLRSIKGVKYLIKAMEHVLDIENNCKLIIIGDGPEKKNLELLTDHLGLTKNVMFLGSLPRKLVMNYLRISDVFVLPSLSEGFPNVILEAMSVGLPVITTNFEGSLEIVKEGVNGFIVEMKNPSELSDRIIRIINDDNLKFTLSANNKEEIKRYDWSRIINNLEGIYFQCKDN